jgi:peptidylprolyl isomerase
MRRSHKLLALIAVPALVALSACTSSAGNSSSTGPSALPTSSAGVDLDVSVTGQFGQVPKVTIPPQKASPDLVVKTLIQGNGPAINSSSLSIANYVTYLWDGSSNKLAGNTWTAGSPDEFVSSSELPGLVTALNGRTAGSRVLAIIPPADAYGSSGNPAQGLSGSDTLVFVIDILATYDGSSVVSGTTTQAGSGLPTVTGSTSPTITVPGNSPPSGLLAKTLIKGSGPVVQKGDSIVAQYTGANWRTGKVFDSSWSRKTPLYVQIGASPAKVITGWNALEGQTVGSRVLLVIPPSDGYGAKGQSSVGIKGTDSLVFVVDILGAYK